MSKHKMTTQTQLDHHANIQNKNVGTMGVNKTYEKAQMNRNVQIQQSQKKN